MSKVLVTFIVLAAVGGCPSQQSDPTRIEPLFKGDQACRQTEGVAVARSDKELESLWYDATCSNTDRPQVDFSRDMVVAYFLGQKPTTGYGVEIEGVDVSDSGLMLRPVHLVPGQNCMVGQAITFPVVVVRMPLRSGSVAAGVAKTRPVDCP